MSRPSDLPDYVDLDGFEIDESQWILHVNYSEPDQGGTRLLLLYRVPLKDDRNLQPWLDSGYTFDQKLRHYVFDWEEMPDRLKRDARMWLVEQIAKAEHSGKTTLAEALGNYLHAVTEGAV